MFNLLEIERPTHLLAKMRALELPEHRHIASRTPDRDRVVQFCSLMAEWIADDSCEDLRIHLDTLLGCRKVAFAYLVRVDLRRDLDLRREIEIALRMPWFEV